MCALANLTEDGSGHAPTIFRNPDRARAYKLLAKDGPNTFYRGPIGRAVVRRMNAGGADWKMSDLSSFKSEWVNPITTSYKGYDVYEMPPQTQGFATLEMLNILQEAIVPEEMLAWRAAGRVGYQASRACSRWRAFDARDRDLPAQRVARARATGGASV